MYSSGLRVSDVCHLRYEDIRRSQKMIHVLLSKNRQDRYTILSDRNLEVFTEYWYQYDRPRGWPFPSTVRDAPLTTDAVEPFVRKYARALSLPEEVTPHTLRHCFACYFLEDGISHTFIQQLLGHRSPNFTDVYLQMTSKRSWESRARLIHLKTEEWRPATMGGNPTVQDVLRRFYPKYLETIPQMPSRQKRQATS